MYFSVRILAASLTLLAYAQDLLEPFDGNTTFPDGPGVHYIANYFTRVWPWLIGVGVGLALLRVVIGGIAIMNSGGNPGLRSEAKEHIKWAIIGFLMLIMAGAILATVNPSAYGVV